MFIFCFPVAFPVIKAPIYRLLEMGRERFEKGVEIINIYLDTRIFEAFVWFLIIGARRFQQLTNFWCLWTDAEWDESLSERSFLFEQFDKDECINRSKEGIHSASQPGSRYIITITSDKPSERLNHYASRTIFRAPYCFGFSWYLLEETPENWRHVE